MTNLQSSAPHIHDASHYNDLADWGPQPDALDGTASHSHGRLLHKSVATDKMPAIETGLWTCTPGRWQLAVPRDELLWVMVGQVEYEGTAGDKITMAANDAVLFPAGWRGVARVVEPLRVSYILSATQKMAGTPDRPQLLRNPLATLLAKDLKNWGVIPTMLEGESTTAGLLLNRAGDGSAECGFWTCTPGFWHCHVTRDEYCHFLVGDATYTNDATGEVIEIKPDTLAFFPKDWRGTCRVHRLVKKIYLIV
ncbi:MAG: cupin domain-containing protein [Hydrotalea sp.]|nr:cupin domain-containing protein [Hydrotalea sp.]